MELDIDKIGNLTFTQLCEAISHLIDHDFEALMRLLYRIDVDEQKLRAVILENTERNSAEVISVLIIDRLAQRDKLRAEFKQEVREIPEEDRW